MHGQTDNKIRYVMLRQEMELSLTEEFAACIHNKDDNKQNQDGG